MHKQPYASRESSMLWHIHSIAPYYKFFKNICCNNTSGFG